MAEIRSMSAGTPCLCTGSSAVVRGVMRRSMSSGWMLNVRGSISAKIGIAPQWRMAAGVARNENADVITSSPGWIPTAASAMWMAAVPPLHARLCRAPRKAANSRSSAFISGAYRPSSVDSAHNGPSSSTRATARLSASVTIGHGTFRLESTTGVPPNSASLSVMLVFDSSGRSFPGPDAFVHQPTQLPAAAQLSGRRKSEIEFEQLQLVIPPRIRDALLHAALDRLLHLINRRRIAQFKAEFDGVAVTRADHGDLPVTRDLRQIVEQLLEEPRTEIAHPAVDHLVRAAPDLCDATG